MNSRQEKRVSCIYIPGNEGVVETAIDCFIHQDCRDKELLIIGRSPAEKRYWRALPTMARHANGWMDSFTKLILNLDVDVATADRSPAFVSNDGTSIDSSSSG